MNLSGVIYLYSMTKNELKQIIREVVEEVNKNSAEFKKGDKVFFMIYGQIDPSTGKLKTPDKKIPDVVIDVSWDEIGAFGEKDWKYLLKKNGWVRGFNIIHK